MKRHIFAVLVMVVAVAIAGCTKKTAEEPTTGHMHDYRQSVVKEASCEAEGEYLYQCTACGHSYTEQYPKRNHSYSPWQETKAPSCAQKGEERRECEICDDYETREIATLAHDKLSHNGQTATCTIAGWNAYETCVNCSYTTYAELPALGHSYGPWQVVNNPTTTAEGKLMAVCKTDNSHIGTVILPKLSTTNGYTYPVITPATETASGLGRYTYNKDGALFHFDVEIARNETEFDPR